MPKDKIVTKCLLSFGAGIAVGVLAAMTIRSRSPKAFEILNSVLQKMGFEWGDIILMLWDPEADSRKSALQLNEPKIVSPPRKGKKPSGPHRASTPRGVTPARRHSRVVREIVLS